MRLLWLNGPVLKDRYNPLESLTEQQFMELYKLRKATVAELINMGVEKILLHKDHIPFNKQFKSVQRLIFWQLVAPLEKKVSSKTAINNSTLFIKYCGLA